MNDSLTRLIRLSKQIRQHHKNKRNVEAANFDPKDDDCQPLADTFEAYLGWRLSMSRFKLPDGFLKTRIRETMLARWRRISYHSSSLSRKTSEVPSEGSAIQGVEKDPRTRRPPTVLGSEALTSSQVARSHRGDKAPVSVGERSRVLTLGSSFKLRDEMQSKSPSKNTKSLVGVEASDFPLPPDCSPGSLEFTCPYCGDLQPIAMREQTAWRYVQGL
jgi:hypothetical protein